MDNNARHRSAVPERVSSAETPIELWAAHAADILTRAAVITDLGVNDCPGSELPIRSPVPR